MDHLTWKLQGSDFSALFSSQHSVYFPEWVQIPRERLKPPPIEGVHEIPQICRPHASYHCYRASWDRSCTHPLLRFFLIAHSIYWPVQTMMKQWSVGLFKHIWSRTRPEIKFALYHALIALMPQVQAESHPASIRKPYTSHRALRRRSWSAAPEVGWIAWCAQQPTASHTASHWWDLGKVLQQTLVSWPRLIQTKQVTLV